MMNPMSNGQRFIIYAMAAITGGLIGKLIVDNVIEKKEPVTGEWSQEQVEEVYSAYDPEKSVSSEQEKGPVVFKEPKKGKLKPQYIDYSNAVKHARAKAAINQVANEALGEEELTEEVIIDATQPYIISLEDYALSYENHAKVTLTYYTKDDTLVDASEKVIPDPDKILGVNALVSFGQKSGDVDSVYVRNIPELTDFEVVRLHLSYTESSLGLPAEPEPKKKTRGKPNTRKVKNLDDNAEED
jgi:hypothetical protein